MPDTEPTSFFAGDTVTWDKSLDDYSAADSWTLNYVLRGPQTCAFTAGWIVADGTGWTVTIPAESTLVWTAGDYTLFGWVTKAAERFQVVEQKLTIKPNFAVNKGTFDNRSHVKKTLDAIEACIEGNASRDEKSYSINYGGRERTLELVPKAELIAMHSRYSELYRQELQAERISKGMKGGGKILTRFVAP